MIPTEPNVADNGKYTVTQAAKVLEISRQTIKRHVDAGLFIPNIPNKKKPTTSAQKRLIKTFSGKEIKRYWKNIY